MKPELLASLCASLGFELRVRILEQLALSPEPLTLSAIAALLTSDAAVVGYHARLMAQAGILSSQKSGRFVLYGVNPENLSLLGRFFQQFVINGKEPNETH